MNYTVLASLGPVVPIPHITTASGNGFNPAQVAAVNTWHDALAAIGPYTELWRVSLDRASGARQMREYDPQADYWFGQHVAAAQAAANQAAAMITGQLIPAMKNVAKKFKNNGTHTFSGGVLTMEQAQAAVAALQGSSYKQVDDMMMAGLTTLPAPAGTWPTAFVDPAAQSVWMDLATVLASPICPGGIPGCQ